MSTPPTMPASGGPRSDHSLLWTILAVLLVGGALAFSGAYILARYLQNQISLDVHKSESGGRSVSINTPKGSFRVDAGEVSEKQLGMPIYPGARRKSKAEGATVSIEVPSEKSVLVAAAEFDSDDPPEKVAAYYREHLGATAQERRRGGTIEFVIKGGGKEKVVAVKPSGRGTEIGMANVTEAEAN